MLPEPLQQRPPLPRGVRSKTHAHTAERSGLRFGGPPVQRLVELVVDVAVEPLGAWSVTHRFADSTINCREAGRNRHGDDHEGNVLRRLHRPAEGGKRSAECGEDAGQVFAVNEDAEVAPTCDHLEVAVVCHCHDVALSAAQREARRTEQAVSSVTDMLSGYLLQDRLTGGLPACE